MSRVGKAPVQFGADVQVKIDGSQLTVKGPKGQLALAVAPSISAAVSDQVITLTRIDENRHTRSLHGMTRSLVANMVEGVTRGFSKVLEIQGVGFRAELKGGALVMNLGRSHLINLPVPADLNVDVTKDLRGLTIRGIDRQRVGQFAAQIRALCPPEPYKGKGVRYAGERVRRKEGKSGKA
jgi:large subunit ribosomal protein L6